MRKLVVVVALVAVALCVSAYPSQAAVAVSARYQLRGHLPELGEVPTMRVFATQVAYDAYRTSLGDANVFPPASSLYMSFDKDVLALYTRGDDVGGRCIATTMLFGVSGDRLSGSFDWQSGTCGAPSSAHYPFILVAISRTAADGSAWLPATRTVCAFVGTQDTESCATVGTTVASPTPTVAPTVAPTPTLATTPVPTASRSLTPTVAPPATSTSVAVASPTVTTSRSPVAAASPSTPPDSSPNAVDFWLGAALIGFGVMIGVVLMNARRRPPSGFRRS